MVGRVGFEPTITGARDQYLRPSCPHRCVVWTTAPAASPNSMIQNALVRLLTEQACWTASLGPLRAHLKNPCTRGLDVTGRIGPMPFSARDRVISLAYGRMGLS